MKDRIDQTIKRLERDLENLSLKAQEVLAENGDYIRQLNDVINNFEAKRALIEEKIEECKDTIASLNETEVEKRAQLAILKEVFA